MHPVDGVSSLPPLCLSYLHAELVFLHAELVFLHAELVFLSAELVFSFWRN